MGPRHWCACSSCSDGAMPAAGWNTARFASGYRGSPLGYVDQCGGRRGSCSRNITSCCSPASTRIWPLEPAGLREFGAGCDDQRGRTRCSRQISRISRVGPSTLACIALEDPRRVRLTSAAGCGPSLLKFAGLPHKFRSDPARPTHYCIGAHPMVGVSCRMECCSSTTSDLSRKLPREPE